MFFDQNFPQLRESIPRVLRGNKLIWIRASSVRNGNRFSSPDQFPATLAKSLPPPDGMLAGIPIRSAIPSFHGVNGDAIADFNFSAHQRLSQRRSGAAHDFAVAWNI